MAGGPTVWGPIGHQLVVGGHMSSSSSSTLNIICTDINLLRSSLKSDKTVNIYAYPSSAESVTIMYHRQNQAKSKVAAEAGALLQLLPASDVRRKIQVEYYENLVSRRGETI